MSKRVDITGQQFGDLLVLGFIKNKNTHALYKCLCMLCNKTTLKTYTNLKSGNSKSCQSCGQKISNGKTQDIEYDLSCGVKITNIAKKYQINRAVVYRVKKAI